MVLSQNCTCGEGYLSPLLLTPSPPPRRTPDPCIGRQKTDYDVVMRTRAVGIALCVVFTLASSGNFSTADTKAAGLCTVIGATKQIDLSVYQCSQTAIGKKAWKLNKSYISSPTLQQPLDRSSPPLEVGALLWSDEFMGASHTNPNDYYWSSNIGNYSQGSIVINSPDLAKLDGTNSGHVNLITKKINDPSHYHGFCAGGKFCQFESGRISTRNLVTLKYGYLEARIKMPVGEGNWPAFWLLRDGNYDPSNKTPGEIDVVEWYGHYPTKSWSTLHFDPLSATETSTSQGTVASNSTPLSDGFHTYGIAWLPDSITFYLDGKPVKTMSSSSIPTWPFNNFYYIILSSGVGPQPNTIYGGTWDGWQQSTLSIDWIREWKINNYGDVVKKTIQPMTPAQMLAQLK